MQKQFSLREVKEMIKSFSIALSKEESEVLKNHYKDIIFALRMLKVHIYDTQAYSIKELIQKGWL
jgi:hypothetical protein